MSCAAGPQAFILQQSRSHDDFEGTLHSKESNFSIVKSQRISVIELQTPKNRDNQNINLQSSFKNNSCFASKEKILLDKVTIEQKE